MPDSQGTKRSFISPLQHSSFLWSLSSDQTTDLQQRWSFTCFPSVIYWKSSVTIVCSCHLIETWMFMNAQVHFRCCPVLYMSGCLFFSRYHTVFITICPIWSLAFFFLLEVIKSPMIFVKFWYWFFYFGKEKSCSLSIIMGMRIGSMMIINTAS